MRFGLKDVNELPSMEEFEKLVAESFQAELVPTEGVPAEPTEVPENVSSQESGPGHTETPVQENVG